MPAAPQPSLSDIPRLVEETRRAGGKIDLEMRVDHPDTAPSAVGRDAYRIVQESLTNVVKHASADHVSITLVRKGPAAVVVVEDDGTGFDPAGLRDGALGIAGMRERVALVGGRLTIESSPSRGTTLVAEVPATADAGERRR